MLQELGHGAGGTVYLVRHRRLNTLRAVKFIRSSLRTDMNLSEVNLLKNLKHSGIPIIYDIEEDIHGIYIIEEYINGDSLASIIRRDGNFPVESACNIALQLCEILAYLHNYEDRQIMHLDLKPENIMIDAAGIVKLIDFDNAAFINEGVPKHIGSIGFAAPEQYHRLNPDARADIYGFGMLLLFMLTGQCEQSCIEQIQSKELSNIIKRCIRHNPIQRYQNISRVSADIQKIIKKYSKKSSKLSLNVNLIGMKRGIGTTHIALALTAYLSVRGIRSVYCDRTGRNQVYDWLGTSRLNGDGAYTVSGIDILPDYNGYVEIQNAWQIYIYDYGDIYSGLPIGSKSNLNNESNMLNILVGCGKFQDISMLEAALNVVPKEHMVCILNHMSGRQFYEYIHAADVVCKMYRMPCQYEWHSLEKVTSEMFDELMAEYVMM